MVFNHFYVSKTVLEIISRTNILLKAVRTGYQWDNVIKITTKDTPCIISSISETSCEIIVTNSIIFANVTLATTSDRITIGV